MSSIFKKKRDLIVLVYFLVFLAGCAEPRISQGGWEQKLKEREVVLQTSGDSLAIYHHVVEKPDDKNSKLNFEGYLIGIEKSPTEKIGTTRGLDSKRFYSRPNSWEKNEGRMEHLKRVTNDFKKMFISHVVAFEPQSNQSDFKTRFLYSAYPTHPDFALGNMKGCFSDRENKNNSKLGYYQQGWIAMIGLQCELEQKFKNAKKSGNPYTHVIVISMGWNNDQAESIRRYNLIMKYLKKAYKDDESPSKGIFKPMLVALSWPSVWASESRSWLMKKALHIISYGNKSDDADEVGYTIANYLVNNILLNLKAKNEGLKVVLIGHSMGARLVTRAAFSGPLLKNNPVNTEKIDLIIGLQGAFSVNRFVEGHVLKIPFNIFRTGEGYPYVGHARVAGKMVMTWSKDDHANPFAVALTGAKHIGGRLGYRESIEKGKNQYFFQVKWKLNRDSVDGEWRRRTETENGERGPIVSCDELKKIKKVLMVDASGFVKKLNSSGDSGHNDILDDEMGRFLWASLKCFAK